jgi:hypothetical protein
MNSESSKSAGSGAGRTQKLFRDFSYSSNKSFNLLIIWEMLFPEASLWSVNAFSGSCIFCSLRSREI